jgi:flagellar motor switch protein FliN
MVSVRPFQFSGLPKLTRSDVALYGTFYPFLRPQVWDTSFLAQLSADLSETLHADVTLTAQPRVCVSAEEALLSTASTGCYVLLRLGGTQHVVVCEIDGPFAMVLVDHLLGGHGDVVPFLRPLTDIENGLLSFVVLKILDALKQGSQAGVKSSSNAVTLMGLASKSEEIAPHFQASSHFFTCAYHCTVGARSGTVRLHVSTACITHHFGEALGGSSSDVLPLEQGLSFLAEDSHDVRFEITHLDLTSQDIAQLEAGDIVVLEHANITKSVVGIEGQAVLRVGLGKHGAVHGRVSVEGEDTLFYVERIEHVREPAEVHMSFPLDNHEDGSESHNPATEGLLEDMSQTVGVELARMRMNTAQLAKLRVGQVVRLPRNPLDPVDIVVNGKVYARGELVDVEGELGVRLTQVAGR